MATSKCPKCESIRFELMPHADIEGCRFTLNFIQCASCGAVVGVLPYRSTEYLLGKIAKHFGINLSD